MSGRVRVGAGDDGRLLARKRSASPAEDAELEHEATMLEQARHPGVVALVGLARSREGHLELLTSWVGAHSLATHHPRSVLEAAGTAAAVAATVADLHDLGITHNAITPGHVLLDGEGRPVLCDLRSAAAVGRAPHDADGSVAGRRADDVASVGRLMHHLLGEDPDMDPIPESRPRLFALRHRSERHHRRALRLLADHALAPEPAHRPSARQLAHAIRETVPEARLDPPSEATSIPALPCASPAAPGGVSTHAPGHSDEAAPDEDDYLERLRASATAPPPPRPRLVLLVPAAIAVAAILTVAVTRSDDAPLADLSPAPAQDQVPPPQEAPETALEHRAVDEPGSPCPTPRLVDTDGDGCDDVVEIESRTVRVGTRMWTVGQAGDVVAAGDWDCTGRTTVAVLRPGTGEVFLFDTWPTQGHAVEVPSTALVEGAIGFDRTDARCGPPRLRRADGAPFTLPLQS